MLNDAMNKQVSGAVTTIRLNGFYAGWEQWFLNMSDNHHDSIYCNRDLELRHLKEAKARNARINIFGDLFDAMQGRFDPRRSMAELRPEYRRDDYYDFVANDLAEFLAPYADNIDMISDGNHELAVLKNANTNLVERLVYKLRSETKADIVHGGYGGWLRYAIHDDSIPTPRQSIKCKYFHGSGGEAPVTRGVIHTNRQAVYLPDANVVFNGHNHHEYYIPISRERISNKGELYMDVQHHLRIAGYKQSYGDGSSGWEITRGGVPKPIGCVWMRMYYDESSSMVRLQFIPDVIGADPISVNSNDLYSGKNYADDPEGE